MRDAFGSAARVRGLSVKYQRRCEEHQSGSQNIWGSTGHARLNPSEPHRSVGVELERGDFNTKKNGDAEAFGFYERTPSLPYAAKEDPGSSFTPTSMRRSETEFPPSSE